MELQEFITNTLTEIAQGVSDAKPIYKELGGAVNPEEAYPLSPDSTKRHCDINFEVSLSDSSSKSTKGGIGVALSIISAGGNKLTEQELNSLTKIKFVVPVMLP